MRGCRKGRAFPHIERQSRKTLVTATNNTSESGWWARKRKERGKRALERQLDYQEKKAASLAEKGGDLRQVMFLRSQWIRQKVDKIRHISPEDRVLEVGCGAHGLIFEFANPLCIGIDPLAVDYKRLFPTWQGDALTIAAVGEELPFEDASFEIVLSDNVVDHAEDPVRIIEELVRVLRPGGVLYFTVNVHHPFYDLVSRAHGIWNALGLKFEISPFADHTVHFSEAKIRNVFSRLNVTSISQTSNIAETKTGYRNLKSLNPDMLLKKVFFKNALFEVLAVKASE